MSTGRDDFNKETKRILQERVGNHCSNPDCACLTSGPNFNPDKATRIGVAAHITAASEGSARYDFTLTSEERRSILNGIWLCQNCSKFIDNDEEIYTVDFLLEWKEFSEENARREIEGKSPLDRYPTDGWICGHCRSFVEDLQTVCTSCHAEVAYSATRQERAEAGKTGLFIGFFVSLLAFMVLPDFLNSQFEATLSFGFGLGVYAVVITAVATISMSFICIELEERKYRGKPPRFFRQTRI